MRAAAFVFLAAFFSCLNALAEPLPLEDFVRHSDYIDINISPDGKYYAAQVRVDGRVMLVFLQSEDRKAIGGVQPPNNDEIHSVIWVNNERVVYEIAEKTHWLDRPVSTGELYAVNVDNSRSALIYGFRASDAKTGSRISKRDNVYAHQQVINILEDDPKHILIAEYPWSLLNKRWVPLGDKITVVSELNVYTGRKKKLLDLPHPGAAPLADVNGDIRFAYWIDEAASKLQSSYRNDDGQWQPVTEAFGLDDDVQPVSAAGNDVYFTGTIPGNSLEGIFKLSLADGKVTPWITHSQGHLDSFIRDWDTGIPVIAESRAGVPERHYADIDSLTSTIYRKLAKAFARKEVDITSTTADRGSMIVKVSSDTMPGDYYSFDAETGQAAYLLGNRSWIYPDEMRPTQSVQLSARDGLKLQGYLTLPQLSDEQMAPLVVLVHGGPHGVRDYWEFDHEVQLLANRGFAVLKVNFRGSGGYGKAFEELGYRQWGGTMIDDIVDATLWTTERDDIDAGRVCIYGASYGGYAAMMASAKSPATYQCVIGYAGVYDLSLIYAKGDIPDLWGGEGYLEKVIGRDEQELNAYSPVNHVDKITAGVMLIHGDEDRRVPIAHAKRMRKALSKAGNKPAWLVYGSAGHGVWNIDDQRELYSGILEFLDQHIGPAGNRTAGN